VSYSQQYLFNANPDLDRISSSFMLLA